MLVELLYGDRTLPLELPDDRVKQVLEAKPLPEPASEEALVREALAHPVDSAPLGELVRRGEKVCIIVGDMTRLWARHHVLVPLILDELNRGGIPDQDIFIVSATGDHREQTPEEHRQLVGAEAYRRVRVYDHQAREKDHLVSLGATSYGTAVSINRRVVEADRVILTGGIVYHFLAGWGGGKKAIIPGVAGYDTIMKNHSLAFNREEGTGLNPVVCAGLIDGNPCSDDMVQGASLVGPDFLVNTIINEEVHRIARVVAGNFVTAFKAGCEYVNDHFGVSLDAPAELVIASCGGYPKDINFYQSYKTIYNSHFALKKGGTLLLVSESREGIGSGDFAEVFTAYPNNREREAALRREYTIGGHMGYHTAVVAEENDLLVITDLPDETVRRMGMIPIKTLDEGLTYIKKKHGGIPPATIMPHGGTTLPCLIKR
jgi:lactate racemase